MEEILNVNNVMFNLHFLFFLVYQMLAYKIVALKFILFKTLQYLTTILVKIVPTQ